MVTYDAFGFIQVTLLLFVVLAIASAVVALEGREARSRAPELARLEPAARRALTGTPFPR